MKRVRLIALLLCLLLPLCSIACEETGAGEPPATDPTTENTDYVHASGNFGNSFTYSLYASGKLFINTTSEDPVLMPELEDKGRQPWATYRSMITEVTVGEGVSSLSAHALEGCANLVKVTLSEGLTTVGEAAFLGCVRLETVALPASVTAIPFECFKDCARLQKVWAKGAVTISENAFVNCQKLTGLYLSPTLTTVEAYAFSGAATSGTLFVYLPAPAATTWETVRAGISASGNDALLNATVHELEG